MSLIIHTSSFSNDNNSTAILATFSSVAILARAILVQALGGLTSSRLPAWVASGSGYASQTKGWECKGVLNEISYVTKRK